MIPVAIECPEQKIVLVNNLDLQHQCIRTITNVPISCIISELEKSQLLCDNTISPLMSVSKFSCMLVFVLAFLGGP